jgi:hypothetical protein
MSSVMYIGKELMHTDTFDLFLFYPILFYPLTYIRLFLRCKCGMMDCVT